MGQIDCGCTMQGPGQICTQGQMLYALLVRAWSAPGGCGRTSVGDTASMLARRVYDDHLRGWRPDDVKVERRRRLWTIALRRGRWIGLFATPDADRVRQWLWMYGYTRFVGLGNTARDQLSGYYRRIGWHGKSDL